MEIGQVVDFVEEWNDAHDEKKQEAKKNEVHKRKATQQDWDALFG